MIYIYTGVYTSRVRHKVITPHSGVKILKTMRYDDKYLITIFTMVK